MSEYRINNKQQKVLTDNSQQPADEIDLLRLFSSLLDSKWLIIIITAAFTFIGATYALLATPIYKGDALIQVEEKSSGLPGLNNLEEIMGQEQNPETEMALLKSRKILSYALDKLRLQIVAAPKYKGSLGEYYARVHGDQTTFNDPIIAVLFDSRYAWGGEKIKVTNFTVASQYLGNTFELINLGHNNYALYLDERQLLTGKVNELAATQSGDLKLLITSLESRAGTAFLIKRDYREDVIGHLQKTLTVKGEGNDSGILTATYQGADKSLVEDTLQAIMEGFLMQNISRMSAEIENSIDFLKTEIAKVKGDLEQAEVALNEYRLQNQSVDLSLETQSILEQVVVLDTRIDELSFKETELAQRFTKEHPSYVSLIKNKQKILGQKQELSAAVEQLPETQQQVLRFARDVDVNQLRYLALLNKKQELRVALAGTVGNINIVDHAVVGRAPIKPKKALIVVLACLLGGMFSIMVVVIKYTLTGGITNPEEFEDIGLNIYACIPLSDVHVRSEIKAKNQRKFASFSGKKSKVDKLPLLAIEHPTDISIEAIRSIRTSLHFSTVVAKDKLVMISSANPGVGKSFIAANLAVVISQSGQKVLLIDADMRRGCLHLLFQHQADDGLSEYLIGNNDWKNIIKQSSESNLSFISRGKNPPNPSELLSRERFTTLLKQLEGDYDLVIIDTPPILAVTDASIIGEHVGVSLMVARYNKSSLKEVGAALKRFDLNGVNIKGVVFNATEKRPNSYGGDYTYDYKSKS